MFRSSTYLKRWAYDLKIALTILSFSDVFLIANLTFYIYVLNVHSDTHHHKLSV